MWFLNASLLSPSAEFVCILSYMILRWKMQNYVAYADLFQKAKLCEKNHIIQFINIGLICT